MNILQGGTDIQLTTNFICKIVALLLAASYAHEVMLRCFSIELAKTTIRPAGLPSYSSFILLWRSLIVGCLASTDRNTSNAPGSVAIRDSTAVKRVEVLLLLS